MWLRAVLAGEDGPGRRALPAGELLHPVPLLAILVLLVNDWLAKPSQAVPAWLTGKLSDLAGLVAAPLVTTAALDCALWLVSRLGPRLDFSLRRGRLIGAVLACGAAFAAVKLSPAAAHGLERAAGWIGFNWHVASDPTDLVALPGLAVAAWLGRREIARVPLGRLEVLERRFRATGESPASGLADVTRCGGDGGRARELAGALEYYFRGGPAAPVQAALDRLRRPHPAGSSPSPKSRR